MTPREIARTGREDGARNYEQSHGDFQEAQRRRARNRRRCAVGVERRLYDLSFREGFLAASDRQAQP